MSPPSKTTRKHLRRADSVSNEPQQHQKKLVRAIRDVMIRSARVPFIAAHAFSRLKWKKDYNAASDETKGHISTYAYVFMFLEIHENNAFAKMNGPFAGWPNNSKLDRDSNKLSIFVRLVNDVKKMMIVKSLKLFGCLCFMWCCYIILLKDISFDSIPKYEKWFDILKSIVNLFN